MYGELLHNNIQVLRYNYWCRCRTLLNIYDKTFWENGKLATIFTKELHHKDVKGTLNIYNFFYCRMMNRIYTITCYHRQIYILLILDTSNNHSARIIKDRSYLVDMFTSMRWNVFCSYTSIRRLNKILYLRIFHVAQVEVPTFRNQMRVNEMRTQLCWVGPSAWVLIKGEGGA